MFPFGLDLILDALGAAPRRGLRGRTARRDPPGRWHPASVSAPRPPSRCARPATASARVRCATGRCGRRPAGPWSGSLRPPAWLVVLASGDGSWHADRARSSRPRPGRRARHGDAALALRGPSLGDRPARRLHAARAGSTRSGASPWSPGSRPSTPSAVRSSSCSACRTSRSRPPRRPGRSRSRASTARSPTGSSTSSTRRDAGRCGGRDVSAEGAAPAPPPEEPWRRLQPRTLLVNPVQEVVPRDARAARARGGRQRQRPGRPDGPSSGSRSRSLAGTLPRAGSRRATASRPSRSRSGAGCSRRSPAGRLPRPGSGRSTSARTRCSACSASCASPSEPASLERGPTGGGVRLDGLDARDATGLRDELLHAPARPAAPRRRGARPGGARRPCRRPRPSSPGCAPGLGPAYAPFTLSGVLTVGAIGRVPAPRHRRRPAPRPRATSAPSHDAGDRARRHAASSSRSLLGLLAVVLLVAVCSTAGYALAFWGYRLTRHPGGTIHVTRGAAQHARDDDRGAPPARGRAVPAAAPPLGRRPPAATRSPPGWGTGRGAERGATAVPARPALRVARARRRRRPAPPGVPVTAPLTPHGQRARMPAPLHPRAGRTRAVLVARRLDRRDRRSLAGHRPGRLALASVPLAAALAADRRAEPRARGHADRARRSAPDRSCAARAMLSARGHHRVDHAARGRSSSAARGCAP